MVSSALIRTLAYSDIFDFPLKEDDILKFFIGKRIGSNALQNLLVRHRDFIAYRNGYYCFVGREQIISKRKKREKESIKKLQIARRIALYLSIIPTVRYIGLSGNVAMKNAEKDDDIDFFIITKSRTLWATRLFAIILLKLLGYHRRKFTLKVKNMVCMNMFLDEQKLSLSKKRQDLYSAHEIVQMVSLFDRDNMFWKFLVANEWVKKYLPNAYGCMDGKKVICQTSRQTGKVASYAQYLFSLFLQFVLRFSVIEIVAKQLQLWYMLRHRTKEEITDTMLAFHPNDYRNKILAHYSRNTKRYAEV